MAGAPNEDPNVGVAQLDQGLIGRSSRVGETCTHDVHVRDRAMSHVQDRVAGGRRWVLQRGVPHEGRPREARTRTRRGPPAAAAWRAPTLERCEHGVKMRAETWIRELEEIHG